MSGGTAAFWLLVVALALCVVCWLSVLLVQLTRRGAGAVLCFELRDRTLWQQDAVEFIRTIYDVMEDYTSQRVQCARLLVDLCQKRPRTCLMVPHPPSDAPSCASSISCPPSCHVAQLPPGLWLPCWASACGACASVPRATSERPRHAHGCVCAGGAGCSGTCDALRCCRTLRSRRSVVLCVLCELCRGCSGVSVERGERDRAR
jgi:hypothetical protein